MNGSHEEYKQTDRQTDRQTDEPHFIGPYIIRFQNIHVFDSLDEIDPGVSYMECIGFGRYQFRRDVILYFCILQEPAYSLFNSQLAVPSQFYRAWFNDMIPVQQCYYYFMRYKEKKRNMFFDGHSELPC